jgi:hypothetical protein
LRKRSDFNDCFRLTKEFYESVAKRQTTVLMLPEPYGNKYGKFLLEMDETIIELNFPSIGTDPFVLLDSLR